MDYKVKSVFQRATSFAIIVFVAQILISVQGLVQTKLFSNVFDLTEFGILSTILTVMTTISTMFTLGIADSIIRFARKHESLKSLIMTALIIFSVISIGLFLIFFGAYLVGIKLFQISNYLLILIMILIIAYLRLIIYVYYGLFIGLQSSTGLMFCHVLPYYLNLFLATIISLLYGWTILNIIFGFLVGEFISCLYLFFYSAYRFGIGRFSRQSFRDIFRFSGPSAITVFFWRLFEFTLVLLLYNFLGPESVGIFTIAFSIKRILDLLIYGMGISITPMLYDLFDNQQYSILKKYVPNWIKIYITLIILISLSLFAFSQYIIVIISNSSFVQAFVLLPFLFLATLFEILGSYVTIPYQFEQRIALSEIRKGLAIALIFPIAFILIPTIGLIGAPISLCLYNIIKMLFLLPRSQELFRFDYQFKKLSFIGFSLFVTILIGFILNKIFLFSFELSFLIPIPLFVLCVFFSRAIRVDEIHSFFRIFSKVFSKKTEDSG